MTNRPGEPIPIVIDPVMLLALAEPQTQTAHERFLEAVATFEAARVELDAAIAEAFGVQMTETR